MDGQARQKSGPRQRYDAGCDVGWVSAPPGLLDVPEDALDVELFARAEENGISGYVAATGRSYICPDVERDPRYVQGLDSAKSSLTVPLRLTTK